MAIIRRLSSDTATVTSWKKCTALHKVRPAIPVINQASGYVYTWVTTLGMTNIEHRKSERAMLTIKKFTVVLIRRSLYTTMTTIVLPKVAVMKIREQAIAWQTSAAVLFTRLQETLKSESLRKLVSLLLISVALLMLYRAQAAYTELFCAAVILYPSCRREAKNVVLVLIHLHHKIKNKKHNILETDQSTTGL